jgi:hypothetical protein
MIGAGHRTKNTYKTPSKRTHKTLIQNKTPDTVINNSRRNGMIGLNLDPDMFSNGLKTKII